MDTFQWVSFFICMHVFSLCFGKQVCISLLYTSHKHAHAQQSTIFHWKDSAPSSSELA